MAEASGGAEPTAPTTSSGSDLGTGHDQRRTDVSALLEVPPEQPGTTELVRPTAGYSTGSGQGSGISYREGDGAEAVKNFTSAKPNSTPQDTTKSDSPSPSVGQPLKYGKHEFGYRLAAFVAAVIPGLRTLTPMYNELVETGLLMVNYHNTSTAMRSKGLGTVANVIKESPQGFIRGLDAAKFPPLVTRLLYIIAEGLNQPAMSGKHHSAEDSAVAKDALLRLVVCPEGATLMPLVADRMCAMITSKDWSQQYRGLTALKVLCGDASEPMRARTDEFRKVVMSRSFEPVFLFLHKSEGKIRRVAITVLELTVSSLSREYVRHTHKKFMPQLLAMLTPNSQSELLIVTAKTLACYISSCPGDNVVSYVRPLYCKLDILVKHTLWDQLHGEYAPAVLKAISAMADRVQGSFIEHYDRFMPTLKELITLLGESERPYLRWHAIDCVAHIGLAVGNHKFGVDSPTITTAVLTALSDKAYRSYYILGQVISVAHTLSRAIDSECEDFMRQVVPSVFRILSRCDSRLVEFHAGACALLEWYASHPHGILKPYAYEAACRVLHLVSDREPVVRASAAECLSRVLPCAASSGVACSTSLRLDALAALTSAIEKETEVGAITSEVGAMGQVLGLMRLPFVPPSCIEVTTSALIKCLEFYFQWNPTVSTIHSPPGENEQRPQTRRLTEPALDAVLLQRVADVICGLVKNLEEHYFPSFDKLAPDVSKLLAEPRSWMEHLHALVIMNNILKLGPAACIRYSAFYLPGIVDRLDSGVPSVRAAAAQAVATLAEVGGSTFASQCGRAVPFLERTIRSPAAHFEEQLLSTEVSVVALSCIMQKHRDTPEVKKKVDDLFPMLLRWLPSQSADKLRPPLELICSTVERNEDVAMEHAAHIFHVLQNALAQDKVAKDLPLSKRMRACLEKLAMEPLPEESVRNALGNIFELFSTGETGHDQP